MNPGSIVRYRNRNWVELPSENSRYRVLRPLAGARDQTVQVDTCLQNLLMHQFREERLEPSSFPLPRVEEVQDAASAYLLWQAARLTLREGAAPLRSLGRISVRPRTYQFVPLLMALRLDPVRLFIADDVGVGKTIEALLIARELWDRGEIRRMLVLCPPYLCEQWQKELQEKFHLDAVVIRSGTVGQLDRNKPRDRTIYEYYPVQVASIDYLKTERNRNLLLHSLPDLIIVDEVHGAAKATDKSKQQRHELVKAIAEKHDRHLILLTATPHSGIEQAFSSLLGLLRPDFAELDLSSLSESQRDELARHFVQRTRKDIEKQWESEPCFPQRIPEDKTYALSGTYHELFQKTYDFCAELVRTGETLEGRKRRIRYWGALALFRCVMSSPRAAVTTLEKRAERLCKIDDNEDEDIDLRNSVLDPNEELMDDEQPTSILEKTELTLSANERRKLRELADLAERLEQTRQDTKLHGVIDLTRELLAARFQPIIWCRYVATAEYVGEHLQKAASSTFGADDLQVVVITGRMNDDERRLKIEEIDPEKPRVLVATDCLSEGINLQQKFNAVIHYDLPWNPNRLEQREGRVDRYGQPQKKVRVVRYFGQDNPVDGVVVDVLLNKAREIYKTLGTHVPVPEESESVTEAVLNAVFLRGYSRDRQQMLLQLDADEKAYQQAFHRRWERDAEREKINRTKFAQRALKPEEVQRELDAADAVLGDPNAVKEFVLNACQRLGLTIKPHKRQPHVFMLAVSDDARNLAPSLIRPLLPSRKNGWWHIAFVSPTPEDAEYLGRNHPFVQGLAQYLFESALLGRKESAARRVGAIATREVNEPTTLYLLRLRYLFELPDHPPLMLEEVRLAGFRNGGAFLDHDACLQLLRDARPDANIQPEQKKRLVDEALQLWPWGGNKPSRAQKTQLEKAFRQRAQALEDAHKNIRRSLKLRVRELSLTPQENPDLLGILVLIPVGDKA